MTPCAVHRWSPWRPLSGGLLERRCPCGDVERVTLEAALAAALATASSGLDVLVLSTRKEPDA